MFDRCMATTGDKFRFLDLKPVEPKRRCNGPYEVAHAGELRRIVRGEKERHPLLARKEFGVERAFTGEKGVTTQGDGLGQVFRAATASGYYRNAMELGGVGPRTHRCCQPLRNERRPHIERHRRRQADNEIILAFALDGEIDEPREDAADTRSRATIKGLVRGIEGDAGLLQTLELRSSE